MTMHLLSRVAVAALATAGFASAQDECATAVPILANTPTLFTTATATPGPDTFPCSFQGAPHGNDIWFRYTATSNLGLTVSLCGSGFDTLLQAWSGTCGALSSLACNDDACGLQSRLTFPGVSGQSYYIQVAGWNGASGIGTIEVTEIPPPTLTIVDNLPGTWIDISATGTALGLGDDGAVDIPTTIGNSLFAAGVARVGSNGAVRFAGTGQTLAYVNGSIPAAGLFSTTSQALAGFWDDINTANGTVGDIYWQETQGRLIVQWQAAGFYLAPSEPVTFQIQVPGGSGNVKAQFLYQDVTSPRANGGGSATIGYQAGAPANQNDVEWSFDQSGAVSNGTVLSLVMGGSTGVGTNYCVAVPNSTGQTGLIAGSGSAVVAANNLTLEASRLPNNAFGYFLTSNTEAVTPNPGGSMGVLCLGGQIGRYSAPAQIQNSGTTGSFSLLLNLTMIPTPTGFVTAMVGETRSFTTWHRDAVAGMATSNFTNGLRVTFQ